MIIQNKVVSNTPNEAKWVSPPYFWEYSEIVGAEGIPETSIATIKTGKEIGNEIKGNKSMGIIKSLVKVVFQR